MTEIKQSFKNKKINKNETFLENDFGKEIGAVIENNEKFYNKTGQWRDQFPMVTEKCVGCGNCTEFCPEAAIEVMVVKGKKKVVIDYKYCKGCGICSSVCPLKAITMEQK